MCPNFIDNCDQQRTRPTETFISDIYNGRVWKDFLVVAGKLFLTASLTFGLMININWFQPYTNTISSVGVILSHNNKLISNTQIPGPNEPEHDINSFLFTLVH